jgi:uncharacterized membrane protein HdeD (DUF308 family)
LIGVLFIAFPSSSGTIICYATGIVLCVWGIILMISYFATDNTVAFGSFGLVQGATLVILGAGILIWPDFLKGMLTLAFGLLIIADAVLKLQYAIDLMRIKASGWLAVLIVAVAMAVFGLVAVWNPFQTATVLTIFIGAVLIVDGVADLATVAYISRSIKALKKALHEADETQEATGHVIDVDYKEVK